MSCPFFLPQHILDSSAWNPAPRLPLGEAWGGTCCAPPAGPFDPREDVVRELCNMGYARGRCEFFPAGTVGDAIRFSMRKGATEPPSVVYVIERDHSPIEHGDFDPGQTASILAAQGRAFIESHKRLRES